MIAEDISQCLVQQVRAGVICHRRKAHAPRHARAHAVAPGEAGPLEEQRLVLLEPVRVEQLGAGSVLLLDPAAVRDLAAAGGIERRLAQLREEQPVAERLERADLREHVGLPVADELAAEAGGRRELRRALRAAAADARARDLAMLRHQACVLLLVHLEPALTR